MLFRKWLERWHREREARSLVAEAFRSGEPLKGTSLGPKHGARWLLMDYELEAGQMARVWFGILRHPRPYAFSRQSHNVIECYLYDLKSGRIAVVEGRNVTRARGEDAAE
jgi:hypothetical protein